MAVAAAALLAASASAQINAGQTVAISTLSGTSTTMNGGTIVLDNASSKDYSRSWTLNDVAGSTFDIKGTTSTFSGVLSGSGGITFADTAGTGTLTLTNSSNSYTGITTINSGATVALVDSDLNSDSNTTSGTIEHSQRLVNNGTFDISGAVSGRSLISLSGSGNIILGSNSLTLNDYDSVADKTYDTKTTFGGVISGTGGLVLSSGEITLTGINTYTGATTISSDTLHLSGAGSIASSSAVAIYGTLDATGVSNAANMVTFSSLTGSGILALGANNLTLTNASGYFSGTITGTGNGTLTLTSGTQWLGGTSSFTNVIVNGGTLEGGATAIAYNVQDNATFSFDSNDQIAMTGIISGAGAVTDIGAGVTTISGVQTYTGFTTITGGTFKLSGAGSIAASSGVENDSVFDLTESTHATVTALTGIGTVRLGDQSLTITAGNGDFSGTITGSTLGSLIISGGTQSLSGANTYSGGTEIQGGALVLVVGSSLRSAITVDSGAALNITTSLTTAGSVTALSLGGSGTVNLGANTLMLTTASQTFSGVIMGTGNLWVSGGTQTLTGSNTYSGTTTVSTGTLVLNGGRLATTSKLVVNGTLDATAAADPTLTFAALSGTGAVKLGSHGLEIDPAAGISSSFSGIISGTGGLTVGGTGTQVLAGVNTYSGGTAIASGATLQIGNGNNTGSILGTVADNGTLKFYRLDSSVFANTITGTGNVWQAGVGTTRLTGTNTYTGTTTITAGTLQVGDGGTSGSIDNTSAVVDNGTLAFSRSDAVTINAAISGTGGVSVLNGKVTLTSANSYSGVTTIASGATLALANTASIFSSSSVAINGTLDLSGLAAGTNLASLAGTGTVALGNQALTLTAANTTFSGAITGSGTLTLTGGTQVLSGVSPGFTGTTAVNGGTLNVSGSIANSSVTVASGGTITGGGTIGALSVAANGTVRGVLGNTLTSSGPIALASGSKYTIAMTSTHSANALLSTSGTASVGGAVVSIASTDGSFDLGNKIKILSATAPITGALTLVSGSATTTTTFTGSAAGGNNAALFRSTLSVDSSTPGSVYLTINLAQLTPALTAAGTPTLNQKNVVGGIDAAIAAGKTLPAGLQSLGNDTGAALFTDSAALAGELGADTPLVARSLFNPFIDAMAAHVGFKRPIGKGGVPLETWISAYGGTDITSGDTGEGSHRFRSATDGVVLGAQWTPYTNVLLGGAISAGSANFRVAGDLGKGSAKSLEAGLYGYVQASRHFYNSFAAAVSATQIKTTRVLAVSGSDTLSGKLTAMSFGGRYEAGLQLPWFTPYVGLQDALTMMPSYSETAPAGHGDFALQYASRTVNSGRAEIGLRNQVDVVVTPRWILTPDFILHLTDRLAYAYDLSDGTKTNAAFASLASSDFSVFGAKTGRQGVLASLGADVFFDGGLHVATRLDTSFTQKSQAFTGMANVGYTW